MCGLARARHFDVQMALPTSSNLGHEVLEWIDVGRAEVCKFRHVAQELARGRHEHARELARGRHEHFNQSRSCTLALHDATPIDCLPAQGAGRHSPPPLDPYSLRSSIITTSKKINSSSHCKGDSIEGALICQGPLQSGAKDQQLQSISLIFQALPRGGTECHPRRLRAKSIRGDVQLHGRQCSRRLGVRPLIASLLCLISVQLLVMVALVSAQTTIKIEGVLTDNPARQPFSTKAFVLSPITTNSTISVAPASPTNQKLGGNTMITAVDGVATFTDLTFYRNESNVKLIFSCASCEEGKSAPFHSNDFSITPALRNLGVQYPKPSRLSSYEHPVVAGQSIRPCVVDNFCVNFTLILSPYCEDPVNEENKFLNEIFRFPADFCARDMAATYSKKNYTCVEGLKCKPSVTKQPASKDPFYSQGRTPGVNVLHLDATGGLITNSKLPVLAELIPLGVGSAVNQGNLRGQITQNSCCRKSDCNRFLSACCDCGNPLCALCVFPKDGIASFSTLTIDKAGKYRLNFKTEEFNIPGDDIAAVKEVISYSLLPTHVPFLSFTILAGPVKNIKVLLQPSLLKLADKTQPPLLAPQPQLQFVDDFGNEGVETGQGRLVAHLCHMSEAWEATNAPEGLCNCSRLDCITRSKLSDSRQLAINYLSGEPTTSVDSAGLATYTDLQVSVGVSKLQIVFQWFSYLDGIAAYSDVYTSTTYFEVRPGTFYRMALIKQPNITRGCDRCPVGLHLAGSSLETDIEMLDIFGNRIIKCSLELACGTTVDVSVATAKARLLLDNNTEISGLLQPSEGGQIQSQASNGLLNFKHLKVRYPGRYVFVFSADIRKNDQQVETHNVTSSPFAIVSGAPVRIALYETPAILRGADMELLLDQPKVELLDVVGNRAVSDCYTSCNGQLTGFCTLLSSGCATSLHARLTDNIETNGVLQGEATIPFVRGIASYVNLTVDILSPKFYTLKDGSKKLCNPQGETLTNYTLELRAAVIDTINCQISGNKCILAPVKIQEKVSQLQLTSPPLTVLAKEYFAIPIEVRLYGCEFKPLAWVSANVATKFGNNAGSGTLIGRTNVGIVNGRAVFTDLSIDRYGDGYTLAFEFFGRNKNVQQIESYPFVVQKAAARMKLEIGADLKDTKARAGVPFVVQPAIVLLNIEGNSVDSSAFVTADLNSNYNPGANQEHDRDAPLTSILRGTTVVRAQKGRCQFTDLFLTKANVQQQVQGRFQLRFSVGQIFVDSEQFDVLPQAKMQEILTFRQPGNCPQGQWRPGSCPQEMSSQCIECIPTENAGKAFDSNPLLYVVDQYKNRLSIDDIPPSEPMMVLVELNSAPDGSILMRNNADVIVRTVEPIVFFDDKPVSCMECTGLRPMKCANYQKRHKCPTSGIQGVCLPQVEGVCNDMRSSARSGKVEFTNLRIDNAGQRFSLKFSVTYNGTQFSSVSEFFRVLNSDPFYPQTLAAYSVPSKNRADRPFEIQPRVSAYDAFGNIVLYDSLQDRTLTVRLITQGNRNPVEPPLPAELPPGQDDFTICRLHPQNLVGTTKVVVDSETGQGVFTDLALRQVMRNYRLEFTMTSSRGPLIALSAEFDVTPGMAMGLCNMSIPSGFSELSPQVNSANLVCADAYGNIQSNCETCFDQDCGYSPVKKTKGANPEFAFACPGQVCVQLYRGPNGLCRPFNKDKYFDCGGNLRSTSMGSKDCNEQFCGQNLATPQGLVSGSTFFTDLSISTVGDGYQLYFFANVGYAKMGISREWVYITPPFNVLPKAPRISIAPPGVRFTSTIAQIEVLFDVSTNMNDFGSKHFTDNCTTEFHESFLTTLGARPRCVWTSPTLLTISLGQGAYVSKDTQLLLAPASRITSTVVVRGSPWTSLPATTDTTRNVGGIQIPKYFPALPPELPKPKASIVGPRTIGACDKLTADSSYSSGFAARPFDQITWGLNMSKSQINGDILEASSTGIEFEERRFHSSSWLLGDLNIITVTLRPTAKLPQKTIITIAGLPSGEDWEQPCPVYQVSMVSETCWRPNPTPGSPDAPCISTPLLGPGKDIFATSPGLGNVPVFQMFNDNLYLKIEDGKYMDDRQNTVVEIRIRNPLVPRKTINPLVKAHPNSIWVLSKCEKCVCVTRDQTGCTESRTIEMEMKNLLIGCGRLCLNPTDEASFAEQGVEELPTKVQILSATVSESSQIAGTMNTLTLVLTTNVPLGSGAEIWVLGLEKIYGSVSTYVIKGEQYKQYTPFSGSNERCAFGQDGSAMLCQTCGEGTSYSVLHDPVNGYLIFRVRNGTKVSNPNLEVTLSWRVKNPDTPGPGVNLRALIMYSKISLAKLYGSSNNQAFITENVQAVSGTILTGTKAPAFQTFDIEQSNHFIGAATWITMQFSANTDIPSYTIISLSGVYFAENKLNLSIPLYSQDSLHLCFEHRGQKGFARWEPTTSKILLSVSPGCEILSFSVVTISFMLRNPDTSASGQVPTLMAFNQGCRKCNYKHCICAPDDIANFTLPEIKASSTSPSRPNPRVLFQVSFRPSFTRAVISENNPLEGEKNTISVGLTLNVNVLAGTTFTITGLVGTLTWDTKINVTYGDGTLACIAQFDHDTGRLILPTEDSINSKQVEYQELLMKFDIQNNFTAPTTKLNILAEAEIIICGKTVAGVSACPLPHSKATDRASFLVIPFEGNVLAFGTTKPQFISASIRESNIVFGAENVITVATELNFLIAEGAKITVAGLKNSETTNFEAFTAVKTIMQLFPNCTCDGSEMEKCVAQQDCTSACNHCTEEQENMLASQFRIWQPEMLFGEPQYTGVYPSGQTVNGSWNQASGSLVLEVAQGKSLPANRLLVFTFILKNSFVTKLPVRATISMEYGAPLALLFKEADGNTFQNTLQGFGDKKLTYDEWRNRLGYYVTEKDPRTLFDECDKDRSDSLDFEEVKAGLEGKYDFWIKVPRPKLMDNKIMGASQFPKFEVATLDETTDTNGGFAFFEISLEANCPLTSPKSPGTRIFLYGLNVFEDDSGFYPILGDDQFDVARSAIGYFDKVRGRLQLSGSTLVGSCSSLPNPDECSYQSVSDLSKKKRIRFSFFLKKKRDTRVDASNLAISVEGYSISIEKSRLTSSNLMPSNLPSPGFLESSIDESSNVLFSMNDLTVKIVLNTDMNPSSFIKIFGLVDTETENGPIEIKGQSAFLFGMQGNWTQSSGTLDLTIVDGASIKKGQPILFTFTVRNRLQLKPPNTPEVKPKISGEVSVAYSPVWVKMNEVYMRLRGNSILTPFELREFSASSNLSSINVENQVKYAVSTVTVSLIANVGLLAGISRVTLTGLSSNTPSGRLSISGPNNDTFGGVADWSQTTGKLLLTLAQDYLAFKWTVFTFQLQNSGSTSATEVQIEGEQNIDPTTPPDLVILPKRLPGRYLSGDAILSWAIKSVSESTKVRGQMNIISFSVRPSAPLFEGTQVKILGLYGLQTRNCIRCNNMQDAIRGLGCSDACAACKLPATNASTICIPVFKTPGWGERVVDVLPLFEDGLGIFQPNEGTLILTVAAGQEFSSTAVTRFSLILRNRAFPGPKLMCTESSTLQDIASGKCLTISASNVALCNPKGSLGADCTVQQAIPPISIGIYDIPVNRYNVPRPDTCAVCLRNDDLVAVDDALQAKKSLRFVDLAVFPPSLKQRPTYIPDGPAVGKYSLILTLRNWLGRMGQTDFEFEKVQGTDGPTGLESYQPTLYIDGSELRELFANQRLELVAQGTPAMCEENSPTRYLSYSWKVFGCSGTLCSSSNQICTKSISLGTTTTTLRNLNFPPNFFPPGQTFQVKATARQSEPYDRVVSSTIFICTRVREVVAVISGADQAVVESNSHLMLSARNSYDPEFLTTNAGPSNFIYEWTCHRTKKCQPISAQIFDNFINCLDENFDEPCPLNPDGFWTANDGPSAIMAGIEGPSAGTAYLHKNTLQSAFVGTSEYSQYIYQFGLQVSRNLSTLSPAISSNVQFQQSKPVSTKAYVAVSRNPALGITAIRCDPLRLGKPDLCRQSYNVKRIGSRETIVLYAGPPDDPFRKLKKWESLEWNSQSDLGTYFLRPENVLTSIYAQNLILKAGSVLPGQLVSFRATLRQTFPINASGFADLNVYVAVPPIGGTFSVEPARGLAIDTVFGISSVGWTTDIENLPLTYRFIAHGIGAPNIEFPVAVGASNSILTRLPPGNLLQDGLLRLDVEVYDVWGADALISTKVNVNMPGLVVQVDPSQALLALAKTSKRRLQDILIFTESPVAIQQKYLVPLLQTVDASKDHLQIPTAVVLASSTLNAIADACEGVQADSSACDASKLQRQSLRLQLIAYIDLYSSQSAPSAVNLLVQGNLLRSIVENPSEVSLASAMNALDSFGTMISDALASQEDMSGIVGVMGHVLKSLTFISRSAEIRRQSGQRQLTQAVMESMSGLSALSLKNAFGGSKPTTVSNSAYAMTSTRIGAGTLLENPFKSIAQSVNVILPQNILSNVKSSFQGEAVDVMLIAFDPSVNPLPGTMGPVVGVELRGANSKSALPLTFPMASPVVIELSITSNISRPFNPVTGTAFGPMIQRFDFYSWGWTFADLVPLSVTTSSVQASTSHLSFFSTIEVPLGCDAVPYSPLVNDGCKVCGGDNFTCSGCDWIPNTGRDRKCSGHGTCGVSRCSCSTGWFGSMCQSLCRDELLCSGHGQCNPDNGLSCKCDNGWESDSKYGATGPYCTRQPGGGEIKVAAMQEPEKAASLTMILATSIPVAVCTIFILYAIYWYVTRQAREAEAYRKTIVEFGQSHSHLNGGHERHIAKFQRKKEIQESPTAVVVATEPDGMVSGEVRELKTEASFSYGPNSNFLAQAVADIHRTNIGQQTVERLDRRGKVMRSQIKNRQTVDKYKNAAPQFSHSADTEVDDEENNVFQLENGEKGEKQGNGMGVRKWEGDASAAIGRKVQEQKVKSNGKGTHHTLGGEELAEHTEIAV